jgi:hypothetical protein
VLEALRNLLREVSAILSELRSADRNSAISSALLERSREVSVAWSLNVRAGLAAIGVPREVLERADELTFALAALTPGAVDRNKLLAAVDAVWKVLQGQVLLEFAKIPPGVQAAASPAPPGPAALFPAISDLPNELVPNAVHGWSKHVKDFLKANPFDNNVFVMVAYRAKLEPLITAVKEKLVQIKLNPVVAREHQLTNDLYNPIACLLCCNYGVAIFDRAETTQMHNPNVVYELSMMLFLKRPCAILKHAKLKKMPTDILSMLYEDYSTRKEAVRKLGEWWDRNNA